MMDGEGILEAINGEVFRGWFCRDKKEGYGEITDLDGVTERGGWVDNRKEGGFVVLIIENGKERNIGFV